LSTPEPVVRQIYENVSIAGNTSKFLQRLFRGLLGPEKLFRIFVFMAGHTLFLGLLRCYFPDMRLMALFARHPHYLNMVFVLADIYDILMT
jgi:hypothetical protein